MVSLPAVLTSVAAISPNVVTTAFTSFGFMLVFSAIAAINAPDVLGFTVAFGAIAKNAKGVRMEAELWALSRLMAPM